MPPDKSISHRALILNAIADGEARITNLSDAADVVSTSRCLAALDVDMSDGVVRGVGIGGLLAAASPLDCRNSGTTMRLLAGLLAAQPFESVLVGDESLSRRPMDRVVEPLRLMGAGAEAQPLRVGGSLPLRGIDYAMPVASAQVKSALLLAGLYAEGETRVREPVPTRNHTELMLTAMGAELQATPGEVAVRRTMSLRPLDVEVPGDLSAALVWAVAAFIHRDAELVLPGVGMNPSRNEAYSVLVRLGANLRAVDARHSGAEPVVDIVTATTSWRLAGLEITPRQSAEAIDDLPALAVAATQLEGTTTIRGAEELRVKESDRIAALCEGLRALGARVDELPDGLRVEGPCRLRGARVRSHGDHRIAMALAVAGMAAEGETPVEDAECVGISYPGFWRELARFGAVA